MPAAAPTANAVSTSFSGAIGAIDLAHKTCGSVFVSDSAITSSDGTLCSEYFVNRFEVALVHVKRKLHKEKSWYKSSIFPLYNIF